MSIYSYLRSWYYLVRYVAMESVKYTGHVLLLMAPMGSGKGTLERYIFTQFPDLLFSVSCTTRAPRPGERDGKEYYFISREEFETKISAGEFLEWAEFGGNLYGTLKAELLQPLENGKIILNEIELQGIEQIKKLIPAENRTIIYVEAGDWDALVRRALSRAPISEEELNKRRKRYEHEVAAKPYADVVIDNRDGKLESAQKEFVAVIENIYSKMNRDR